MNTLHYVVFDFETYGLSPKTSEAIQVAGKAYDGRTLEPFPADAGGEFVSMMRPLYPERLDTESAAKALAVNKKTKEEILAAPDQKLVWKQFVDWVGKFNPDKNFFTAPIACGKNIRNFDMGFVEALNAAHYKKKPVLFNSMKLIDLEELIFPWFESTNELPNVKMDTLREFFGMSTEGAHDALVDTRQTGDLVMRFLRLHRELRRRTNKDGVPIIHFKGSCRNAA